jgi:IS5 family transposase
MLEAAIVRGKRSGGKAMAKVRCKETRENSFYGNFLYEQKVSKDHFLRKLNVVIDWDRFTKKLLGHYKGKGEIGQAPYNPTMILKMLLLSYLWDVSERMIEEMADDSLAIGYFLGLGADAKAPDHYTLTLFKNRLIQNAGTKVYEELFNEIIKIAREKGVKFGKLQVVDSVHLVADVNLEKDRKRQKEDKCPRDKDAGWGAKGDKVVVDKDGKKHREGQYFYGYKDQVSLNAESELVTSVIPGYANDYDGHKLKDLVEKDISKGIDMETVTGDRGYDDGENHYYLKQKGIKSAIRLNRRRTEKKDRNKEMWLELEGRQWYRDALKERYKVERKFGEAKKWHGFNRSRYWGFARHAVQSYLTFMALNLKRLVKLLTGVGFRERAAALTPI